MKTPREILLTRLRAAEPKLDAIRQAAVAAVCDRRTSSASVATQSWAANFVVWFLRCLATLWRELVLPSRRLWTGLAAVWVLLVVINVSQRDPVSSVTGQPVHAPPVMMSWQVQQRWMNEILADRLPAPEAERPRNAAPRPRTQTGGRGMA
jgi:hypothetical protein